ncbi:hypothetical protein [Melittangium boletus]|uniref:hypothetical protein n=1 Tax=Melittangium boletus TaxID=83453 RepID=UPI003DA36270
MISIDPRRAALALCCLLGATCSSGPEAGQEARLHRLVPGWGLNTAPVSVVLEGDNFVPVATQHLGGPERVTLESRFEARLGTWRLEDVTWVDEHTLRLRMPEGLTPGWYPLEVETPLGERVVLPRAWFVSDRPLAELQTQVRWERDRLWVGEETRLVLTVENTGGTRARAVQARPRFEGSARVESRAESSAPVDLEPGGSASFAWTVVAHGPGSARVDLGLEAEDEARGEALPVPRVETGLEVRERSALSATLQVDPAVVNVGQTLRVRLRVDNVGPSTMREVRPSAPMFEGLEGAVEGGSVPRPELAELAPGEGETFIWVYTARRTGEVRFRAGAGGLDAFTAQGVTTGEVSAAPITVQTPGRLAAAFTLVPANVRAGEVFLVDLEVLNLGDSPVQGVSIDRGSATGSAGIELLAAPQPTSVDIPGHGRAVFRAQLLARQRGTSVFHAGARGVDQTDGLTVSSPLTDSPVVNVTR